MVLTSNQPSGATAAPQDLRYRRAERPAKPTDPQPSLVLPDVEGWQRAIERARTPGERVPLERVFERLDEGADNGDEE